MGGDVLSSCKLKRGTRGERENTDLWNLGAVYSEFTVFLASFL
jgi:hypothetical protein